MPPSIASSTAPSAAARSARRPFPRHACRRCLSPVTAWTVHGSSNKAPEKVMSERSYRGLFWTLALVGASLDQATKYGVFSHLSNGGIGGQQPAGPGAFQLGAHYIPKGAAGVPPGHHRAFLRLGGGRGGAQRA